MRLHTATLVMTLAATAALAHSGVKNAAVKARMDLMGEVKAATATLGDMSKGAKPFDAAKAEAARAALERHATRIPALFKAPESDPKTEARPEIWTDWDGFVAIADRMETVASAMDTGSLKTLRAGMGRLAKTCKSCHEAFRIKK
ncbi:cytochrome c [Thalassococcus sp. CAU 1522]|uniref:Cytochrome c n=1 Tax=Thalassococcus arenae TaxID=2851652 RepID=A0ABS6N5C8_9RHOB|nr:cytochrome c [Thalassococcus arenae]MBV2359213.1 cytochrome c [Thalassococcus arenae]